MLSLAAEYDLGVASASLTFAATSGCAGVGLNTLRAQHKALRQYGRLYWVHWCVLALSVAVTLVAWYLLSSFIVEQTNNRFE